MANEDSCPGRRAALQIDGKQSQPVARMKRSEIRGRPPRIALRSMRATEESEATLDPGSAAHPLVILRRERRGSRASVILRCEAPGHPIAPCAMGTPKRRASKDGWPPDHDGARLEGRR